ncbi:MAG TPA: hypothetical protein DCZ49_05590 [Hyphomonadaceae bacterium]|nr:hypothetical protein [Hyphomonadaceae bacterium]
MTTAIDLRNMGPSPRENFGRSLLRFSHNVGARVPTDDSSLAALIEAYPRDKLGLFTMSADPFDWRSWRRGDPGDLSGAALVEAVHAGRLWLNLRNASAFLPDFQHLAADLFNAFDAQSGQKSVKRDVGVLISSANAHVTYHLDAPLVTLWQLRGEKRVYLYPPAPPFADAAAIEGVVLRETAEQLRHVPAFDDKAETLTLTPGEMITWPQFAPHRVVNGPMLNVALSCEFQTLASLLRVNAVFANGVLRRRFGAKPVLPGRAVNPAMLAKVALARALKSRAPTPVAAPNPAPLFRLDPARPGQIIDPAPALAR